MSATLVTSSMSGDLRSAWGIDPGVSFLNHGSFGACPTAVLEHQKLIIDRIERQPVRFYVREIQGMLDDARAALSAFLGANPQDLVFVDNATTGVNTVLQSLSLAPGDEVLITNQEYNACKNALNEVARRTGAKVVVVDLPFPTGGADLVAPLTSAVTDKTRLVMIDHVVSQTGLVLPIDDIIAFMNARGVETLIDGAHAPGMIPLNLEALGATYYTGNCHKWMCTPKGVAFLHVRHDRRGSIRPLVISHAANAPVSPEERFQREFDWVGTRDPSGVLTLPFAISYMEGLVEGGWDAIMAHNHGLALEAQSILVDALGIELPCEPERVGSMVSLPLPDGHMTSHPSPLYLDPVQDVLLEQHGIEVPIIPWPAPPRRLIRLSAQIYNKRAEYERLARVLPGLLQD